MLIIFLLLAIAFIVISTAKFKLHPFLALIIAAIGYGLCSGMPLSDIVKSVNNGFGNTVGSIGIVIIAGCIIGTFLEESGSAYVIARSVMRMVGEKRVPLAMLILGHYLKLIMQSEYSSNGSSSICRIHVKSPLAGKFLSATSQCSLRSCSTLSDSRMTGR